VSDKYEILIGHLPYYRFSQKQEKKMAVQEAGYFLNSLFSLVTITDH